MNNSPKRTRPSQNGFTLIELLVVVLIIGILAAVAVPQYFKIVEKGRFAEATTCLSAIKGSMERYNIKKGDYLLATTALMDVQCPATMRFFAQPTITPAAAAYTIAIARNTVGTTSYGRYTTDLRMPAGTFTCTSGSTGTCTDLIP